MPGLWRAEQRERDRFCRRCGVNQSRRVDPFNSITGGLTSDIIGRAERFGKETRPLSGSGIPRRSYSGPLVGIVTQGLSEQTASFHAKRWVMLLIRTLVAAPLWLMIVLLSPLDAYVAAKDIAKQV